MNCNHTAYVTRITRAIYAAETLRSTLKELQLLCAYTPGAPPASAWQDSRDSLSVLLSALRTHLPAGTTEQQTCMKTKSLNTSSGTLEVTVGNVQVSAPNIKTLVETIEALGLLTSTNGNSGCANSADPHSHADEICFGCVSGWSASYYHTCKEKN